MLFAVEQVVELADQGEKFGVVLLGLDKFAELVHPLAFFGSHGWRGGCVGRPSRAGVYQRCRLEAPRWWRVLARSSHWTEGGRRVRFRFTDRAENLVPRRPLKSLRGRSILG